MKRVKSQKKSFILSRESIDEASEWLAEILSEADFNRKDILKFRLSVEDVMLKWLEEIGEGTECIVKCGTRLRRSYLSLSAAGSKSNPREFDSYDENMQYYINKYTAVNEYNPKNTQYYYKQDFHNYIFYTTDDC